MTKTQTIGQAAESYFLTKEAFQKRIIRAMQSDKYAAIRQELRIDPDTETGLKSLFTPQLMSLLLRTGLDISTGITPKPDKKTDNPNPTRQGQEEKPDEIPVQNPTPKPDTSGKTKPDAETKPDAKPDTSISDRFFTSEIIILAALMILIFSDGFSMSLLAGRTFSGNELAYILFSVVGLIIGYSAISTTRAAYLQPRRAWEKSWAGFWIILFSIFQTALHGAAFDLFGEWSEVVGRVLIVVSIPLATASLTTTILKK